MVDSCGIERDPGKFRDGGPQSLFWTIQRAGPGPPVGGRWRDRSFFFFFLAFHAGRPLPCPEPLLVVCGTRPSRCGYMSNRGRRGTGPPNSAGCHPRFSRGGGVAFRGRPLGSTLVRSAGLVLVGRTGNEVLIYVSPGAVVNGLPARGEQTPPQGRLRLSARLRQVVPAPVGGRASDDR